MYQHDSPKKDYLVIVHRRVAEHAKRMNIFLSADPGGIGSAFHRAEEGRKKKLLFKAPIVLI
jgi:hypothetical protein